VKTPVLVLALCAWAAGAARGEPALETDTLKTTAGELVITFVGHGSLVLSHAGKVVHIDPWSQLADYSSLPKADLVLITHDHRDHLDANALKAVRAAGTVVAASAACAAGLPGAVVLRNGDTQTVHGVRIEAVPAYNLRHKRPDGPVYHPRGVGNGYVLTFANVRIYVAGDTEDVPEMKALRNIDVAFLPMNLPYTMTPEMVADAARAFRPRILYPYHYGETDPQRLVGLLRGEKGIEVRIRALR
jgi:L-ascorbate metabolism protein UlaG (beta-lactamase superfamily)